MAPTRIPEGFVLVKPRSVELATALLKAADEIKVDRQLSIRTVHGGYHVAQAVAEKFQESFPDAEIEADGEIEEVDETQADETEDNEVNETEDETKLEPLPVTADSSVAEIDAYAEKVKVDVSAAKNRTEKIELLEAARQPKTDDAE